MGDRGQLACSPGWIPQMPNSDPLLNENPKTLVVWGGKKKKTKPVIFKVLELASQGSRNGQLERKRAESQPADSYLRSAGCLVSCWTGDQNSEVLLKTQCLTSFDTASKKSAIGSHHTQSQAIQGGQGLRWVKIGVWAAVQTQGDSKEIKNSMKF